ncbi:hypothetical protein MEA186_15722 [Mesorhizobium amorphae CCNWGS0123]|uniref:Uncharacterized protein n=1 Tax=Mesorhizobium amorphae CCNWGS0123 TaxID=1082933 RepID=G6YB20_9HYPH|nr:hypothetical protein MEA186_15722 [Mesorhizobium amorphae CCNWGS0123]
MRYWLQLGRDLGEDRLWLDRRGLANRRWDFGRWCSFGRREAKIARFALPLTLTLSQ